MKTSILLLMICICGCKDSAFKDRAVSSVRVIEDNQTEYPIIKYTVVRETWIYNGLQPITMLSSDEWISVYEDKVDSIKKVAEHYNIACQKLADSVINTKYQK